jgi:hypothetical protein
VSRRRRRRPAAQPIAHRLAQRTPQLLLICLGFAACSGTDSWDHSPAELAEQLARGNHAVLLPIDFAAYPAAHALRLGQDAPLFVAMILIELGRSQPAVTLLELQTRRGPGWARTRANLLLAEQRIELGHYTRAVAAARRVREAMPASPLGRVAALLETRAEYGQRADIRVLANIVNLQMPSGAARGELLLMRAVARQRLGRSGWQADLLQLAQAEAASDLHARAWSYLVNSVAPGAAQESLIQLMEAKSHLAGGNRRDALHVAEQLLVAEPSLATAPLLNEVGSAYRALREQSRGAAFFRELNVEISGATAAAGKEQLARLARDAGDFAGAAALLEELLAAATGAAARDRYRWLLLDIYVNRAPQLSPRGEFELVAAVHEWHDPGYFADLLQEEVSGLLAVGNWSTIAALYGELRGRDDGGASRARLAYLLARGKQAGLVGLAPTPTTLELLQDTVLMDPGGYYGLLATEQLAGDRPSRLTPETGARSEVVDELAQSSDEDRFIAGLFRWGLFDRGLAEIRASSRSLSGAVLREASGALQRADRLRDSIGVASRVLASGAADLRVSDYERAYPRYFAAAIETLDLGGVPASVFFALIREESRFDADIVSSAGAIGLTQLMPLTAADEARRMRFANEIRLTDPAQNLLIGSTHLARLFERLEGDVARSLMAYNAGLSRVRNWDRQFSHLPADLYLEALPFAETRGYVRKILASGVFYGELYADLSIAETVALFFGEPTGDRR